MFCYLEAVTCSPVPHNGATPRLESRQGEKTEVKFNSSVSYYCSKGYSFDPTNSQMNHTSVKCLANNSMEVFNQTCQGRAIIVSFNLEKQHCPVNYCWKRVVRSLVKFTPFKCCVVCVVIVSGAHLSEPLCIESVMIAIHSL